MQGTFQEKRRKLAQILEMTYLCLFAVLLLYIFLGITSFPIPWKSITLNADGKTVFWAKVLFEAPYYLLQIIVLLRFVVQEKYELKKMFTAAIVFISGYYLWTASEHRRLLLFWLLILGAWKIPFQKVIKVFVRVIGPMMIVTTFCAVVGLIDDYTYTRADFIRHSFGIVSPTNYGAMVFFLVLCWWYLRREKMTWKEIFGVFGIAVFLHLGCHARCSTVLTAVAGILMGMEKMLKERKHPFFIPDVLVLSPVLVAIGMTVLTIMYQGTPMQQKLNQLLSNRLDLGKKAFDIFSLTPFGQYIRLFSNAENLGFEYYFYIDSTYLQLIIMYGVVILGVVLLVFLLIGCRAKAQKDWIFLWIIGLIAAHSIIEQHLVELPYCPFVIALLADTEVKPGLKIKEIFGKVWTRN